MGKQDFNRALAVQLWTEVYSSGSTWDCIQAVVRIAAQCGLGVLEVEAMDYAVKKVTGNGRGVRHYRRDRHDPLDPRWADYLLEAATLHPPKTFYPIREPCGHVVGVTHCLGTVRKGQWSRKCYRAAWGNILPFGLEMAEKECPKCHELMKYWCWDKQASNKYGPPCQWSIDHRMPVRPGGGGCHCHFNLQAMHLLCNISKGGRL
jgi:hypothetical protein